MYKTSDLLPSFIKDISMERNLSYNLEGMAMTLNLQRYGLRSLELRPSPKFKINWGSFHHKEYNSENWVLNKMDV